MENEKKKLQTCIFSKNFQWLEQGRNEERRKKKKIWCRKRGLGYYPTVLQGLEVLYCEQGLYCSLKRKGLYCNLGCVVASDCIAIW